MALDTHVLLQSGSFDVDMRNSIGLEGLQRHPVTGRDCIAIRLRGGVVLHEVHGAPAVAGGDIYLEPESTSYVEIDLLTLKIVANASAFTEGRSSLYIITTGVNPRTGVHQVMSIADHRGLTP